MKRTATRAFALTLAAVVLTSCGGNPAADNSHSTRPTQSGPAANQAAPTVEAIAAGTTPAPGVMVFPPGPCGAQDCLARFEGSVPNSGPLRFRIATEGFYSVSWFLHPDPGSQCKLTALSLVYPDGSDGAPAVEVMQGQTTITTALKPGDFVFKLGVSGCFWRVLVQKAASPY